MAHTDIRFTNFSSHLVSLNHQSEQLNLLFDGLVTAIQKLQQNLDTITCRLENEVQFTYRLMAISLPAQFLSKLVGRETAAAITSGILSEFSCSRVNLHIIPYLYYQGIKIRNQTFSTVRERYQISNCSMIWLRILVN